MEPDWQVPCWTMLALYDFRRLNSRYRMMPSVLLTIWLKNAHLLTWACKEKWLMNGWNSQATKQTGWFRLAKGDLTRLWNVGTFASHREVSLEDTHSGPPSTKSYHYALIWLRKLRSLSSGGPAPWRRTWTQNLSHLDLTATTEILRTRRHSTPGRTRIRRFSAATDHGAVPELGHFVLGRQTQWTRICCLNLSLGMRNTWPWSGGTLSKWKPILRG